MGKLRILSEKYNSFITTSDIDQTYLATELGSKKGMLSTLFETPDQKFPLPGMPIFYNKLRENTDGTPLAFISASPHYFRRALHATIRNHGIEMESLHLKYLDGTIKGVLDKVVNSVFNLNDLLKEGVGPAVDRAKKFFGSTYQSLI
jgi:phosphatidate phosphatase APP1